MCIQPGVKGIPLEISRAAIRAEEQAAGAGPGAQEQEKPAAPAAAISVSQAFVGAGGFKQAGVFSLVYGFTGWAAPGRNHHGPSGTVVRVGGGIKGKYSAAVTAASGIG